MREGMGLPMSDYSEFMVHAKTYLREAEESLKAKRANSAVVYLKLVKEEVERVIHWVEKQ